MTTAAAPPQNARLKEDAASSPTHGRRLAGTRPLGVPVVPRHVAAAAARRGADGKLRRRVAHGGSSDRRVLRARRRPARPRARHSTLSLVPPAQPTARPRDFRTIRLHLRGLPLVRAVLYRAAAGVQDFAHSHQDCVLEVSAGAGLGRHHGHAGGGLAPRDVSRPRRRDPGLADRRGGAAGRGSFVRGRGRGGLAVADAPPRTRSRTSANALRNAGTSRTASRCSTPSSRRAWASRY